MSMLTTKRNSRMLESSKVDRKISENKKIHQCINQCNVGTGAVNKVDIEAIEWHNHKKEYEIVQEMLL